MAVAGRLSGQPFLLSGLDCIGERVAVRSGGRLQPGYVLDWADPGATSAGGIVVELDSGNQISVPQEEVTTKIVHWNEPDRSLPPVDELESESTDEAVLRELQEQQEREEAWLRSRLPQDPPKPAGVWEGRRTVAFAGPEAVIVPQPAATEATGGAGPDQPPPTYAEFSVPVRVGVSADALLLHASAFSGCDVAALRASRIARDDSHALLRNETSALVARRCESFESGLARLGEWPIGAPKERGAPAVVRVDWDSPVSGTLVPAATALEIDDGGAAGEVLLLTLLGRRKLRLPAIHSADAPDRRKGQPAARVGAGSAGGGASHSPLRGHAAVASARLAAEEARTPPGATTAALRVAESAPPRKALASAALRFRDVVSLLAWRHRQLRMLQRSPVSTMPPERHVLGMPDSARLSDPLSSDGESGPGRSTRVTVWVPVFAARLCAGGSPAGGSTAREASWVVGDGSAEFETGPWRMVHGVPRSSAARAVVLPCGFVRVTFAAALTGSLVPGPQPGGGGGARPPRRVYLPASPSGVRLLPASVAAAKPPSPPGEASRRSLPPQRQRRARGVSGDTEQSGAVSGRSRRSGRGRGTPGVDSALDFSTLDVSDDAEVSFAVSEIGASARELELPAVRRRAAGRLGPAGAALAASVAASSPRSSDGVSAGSSAGAAQWSADRRRRVGGGGRACGSGPGGGGGSGHAAPQATSAAARADRAGALGGGASRPRTAGGGGTGAAELPGEWTGRDKARWRRVVRAAEAAGAEAGPGLRPAAIYGREQRLGSPRPLSPGTGCADAESGRTGQRASRAPGVGQAARKAVPPRVKRVYEAGVLRSPAVEAERADPREREEATLADATETELHARFGLDASGEDLSEAVSRLRARVWERKDRVGTLRVATRRTEAALRSNTALLRQAAAGRLASAHAPASGATSAGSSSAASAASSSRLQGSAIADAAVQLRRFRTATSPGMADAAALVLGAAGEDAPLWQLPSAARGSRAPPSRAADRARIERLQALCARQHSKLRAVVVARGLAAAAFLAARDRLAGLEERKRQAASRVAAVRRRQLWRANVPEAAEAAEQALGRAAARAALGAGAEGTRDYALAAATMEPLSAASRAELVAALARLSAAEREFLLAGLGPDPAAAAAASPALRVALAIDQLVAEQQRLDTLEARLAELSTEAVAVEERTRVLRERAAARQERWQQQRARLQVVVQHATDASEGGGEAAMAASRRLAEAQRNSAELRRLISQLRSQNAMRFQHQQFH